MNTAHYKSPAFDKIMAESVKASDEAQRTAAYAKAEQQLDKDSAIVPVYYYVNARLVKPWSVATPVKTRWITSIPKTFTLSNINGNTWSEPVLAPSCLI